jgi:hypothetical protein
MLCILCILVYAFLGHTDQYKIRTELFRGTVPANKNYVTGTVPANKNYVTGTAKNGYVSKKNYGTYYKAAMYSLGFKLQTKSMTPICNSK